MKTQRPCVSAWITVLLTAVLVTGVNRSAHTVPAGMPIVAQLRVNQAGSTMTGDLRLDLSGGAVQGQIDITAASNSRSPVKRRSGGAAAGRLQVRIELSGVYRGGPYGVMEGTAKLSGTFADDSSCTATVSGIGMFRGSVSAPLGLAEATASWERVEFAGCDLMTPQPFTALLPPFAFDATETIPSLVTPPPSSPRPPGGATEAPPASTPVPDAAGGPSSSGGGAGMPIVLPQPGIETIVVAVVALLGFCVVVTAGLLVVRLRQQAVPVLKVRASLSVRYANGGTKVFEIRSTRTTIGRGPDNALVLRDPSVSTHHAEIVATREGFYLKDRGSTGGTRVNGQPVAEVSLVAGDDISVGTTTVTLEP